MLDRQRDEFQPIDNERTSVDRLENKFGNPTTTGLPVAVDEIVEKRLDILQIDFSQVNRERILGVVRPVAQVVHAPNSVRMGMCDYQCVYSRD